MKFPDMDQKSFRASPASGNESGKCMGGGDPFDSLDFLLELVDSVSRLMFSVPDLLQKVVLFHLRLGI